MLASSSSSNSLSAASSSFSSSCACSSSSSACCSSRLFASSSSCSASSSASTSSLSSSSTFSVASSSTLSSSSSSSSSSSTSSSKSSSAASDSKVKVKLDDAPKSSKRKVVQYKGRTIYEWEQDLEEVNIFITPPPNVPSKMFDISIKSDHIKVGIKNNPPYIDEDSGAKIDAQSSFWTLEDGIVHLQLQKMYVGEVWECALKGKVGIVLNPQEKQQEQQRIMLERFQRENPGFDFSGATFSGSAPDPRKFMGGIDYNRIRQ